MSSEDVAGAGRLETAWWRTEERPLGPEGASGESGWRFPVFDETFVRESCAAPACQNGLVVANGLLLAGGCGCPCGRKKGLLDMVVTRIASYLIIQRVSV